MYNLKIIPDALENLNKLDTAVLTEIKSKAFGLKENPRPTDAEELTPGEGYRVRVGDIRISYRVDSGNKEIIIYSIR